MLKKRHLLLIVLLALVAVTSWQVVERLDTVKTSSGGKKKSPAPVAVAEVERSDIEWRRGFSGSLESRGQFEIAAKISGRVEQLDVDLGDVVTRGQQLGQLDDDEYVQAVLQAEAELAVAQANRAEAVSSASIAARDLQRVRSLATKGIRSDAQLDTAEATQSSRQAAVKVADAQVVRAEAALKTARIRLDYTRILASWSGGAEQRVVAQRWVEAGDTIAANAPLLTIVELDPITAVVNLTEKEYGRLQTGQAVSVTTDAWPKQVFTGTVARISPVFDPASRQARAEFTIANPQQQLKPGMFVRAEAVLDRAENASVIPREALTTRAGEEGVFVVNDDDKTVRWQPIDVGIRNEDRVQINDGIGGRVVVLGQQLLQDGSSITIPDSDPEPAAAQSTNTP